MNIAIISNPNSVKIKDVSSFEKEIYSLFQGHSVTIYWTQTPEDVTNFAKDSVKNKVDIIIAAGGDGIINEIMPQLLNSDVKLGIIPAGTGNMIATNLGIPTDLNKACQLIINNNTKRIDIAQINERYFGFIAGCGIDAKIMNETTTEKKQKYGVWAYFLEGFKHSLNVSPYFVKLRLDNKKIIRTKAVAVMFVNGGSILGSLFTIAPNAQLDDGKLHIVVLSPKTILDYLLLFFELIFQKSLNRNFKIKHYRAKTAELTTSPNVMMQADGDVIENTPATITIIPSAIEVFIP